MEQRPKVNLFKTVTQNIIDNDDYYRGSRISKNSVRQSRYSRRMNRTSLAIQDPELMKAVQKRQKIGIFEDGVDLTPNNLGTFEYFDYIDDIDIDIVLYLINLIDDNNNSIIPQQPEETEPLSSAKSSVESASIHSVDMDDITKKLSTNEDQKNDNNNLTQSSTEGIISSSSSSEEYVRPSKPAPFIKITIRETDDIVLFEQNSTTVSKTSDEAKRIEEDNLLYEYLTTGKGRQRRTNDSEAQTKNILYKSCAVNTERTKKKNMGTFVSNYDMFDTYEELARNTTSLDSSDNQVKIQITTYSLSGVIDDPDELLCKNNNFKLSSMILERLLAGNIYRERQKRFRNMIMPDPLDLSIQYLYRIDLLWSYRMVESIGKAVSCVSWCETNSDLLAIGYGVYDFISYADRMNGYVAVWSIKNPINPERRCRYEQPVTAISFSKETPQLLAVGLYDGMIEVLDITNDPVCCIAKNQRDTSPGFDPIWKIEWIKVGPTEEILTIAENGLVIKFTLTTNSNLIAFRQMHLDKVEGSVEGLLIPKKQISHQKQEANRNSQGLILYIHPVKSDIYFIGTDEGCLYKLSIFHPHQYSGIMQVHRGCVTSIEYSPFSPKIFLTAGTDCKIRIWIEDIMEPVLELSSGFLPIRSACWCPTNSTIIACITKHHVEIWNISKNIFKPVTSHTFQWSSIPLTACCFTKCGRTLIVGDGEGSTHVCALEDMPFSAHFQFQELQNAIYSGLITKPDLKRQIITLGHLGYDSVNKIN